MKLLAAGSASAFCIIFSWLPALLAGEVSHCSQSGTDSCKAEFLSAAPTSVFDPGPLHVLLLNITEGKEGAPPLPPKPVIIATPSDAGTYPVIVFQHGFQLLNEFYRQLFSFVASHGYIIVAPQMYLLLPPSALNEMKDTAEVVDSLPLYLAPNLPPNVVPDLSLGVVMAGHSRGGKVAFGVTMGLSRPSLPIRALIALDPVDGTSFGQLSPPIVKQPGPPSIKLPCPALIFGSGLGPTGGLLSCAPTSWGPRGYFNSTLAPSFLLVAPQFGHMDFLDDTLQLPRGLVACVCAKGPAREPMRRTAGGATVAFLGYALGGDGSEGAWQALLRDPAIAPVKLDPSLSRTSAPTLGSRKAPDVETKGPEEVLVGAD